MDFLELVWTKLAILSAVWTVGSATYFNYNYYPMTHPYTTIAFGPAVFIILLPLLFFAIHFIFFKWE